MKINLSKANQKGLLWLLIGFIVVLLIILGVIVYLIYKWSKMPAPRRGIDITYVGSTTSAAEVERITGSPPPTNNATASKSATPSLTLADVPTDMVMTALVLQRSTNMMDWEDIRSIDVSDPSSLSNVFLLDTNFVSDRAFYRTRSEFQWPQ